MRSNSGRARVPARREDVLEPKDVFSSGSQHVLGFGDDGSRGRDPSRRRKIRQTPNRSFAAGSVGAGSL